MARFYYMLVTLLFLQFQGIFGAINVTVGELDDNDLIKFNGNTGGGSGNSTSTVFVCASGIDFCIGRNDPNYIVPKSVGKEKVENVFSGITTLEGYENNKKRAIVEACDPNQLEKKKCQTRKCAVNEDCLSNLCQSGTCITNSENPLLECNLRSDNNLACSNYLQEKCTFSSQCYGRCKNFVCTYRQLNSLNTSPYLYYSAGLGIMLFFAALFLCCCCCPGIFRWDVKKTKNKNPGVVV